MNQKLEKVIGECPICHEGIKRKDKFKTVCKHVFHKECINNWLAIKNECPCCREAYPDFLDPPPPLTLQDILNMP